MRMVFGWRTGIRPAPPCGIRAAGIGAMLVAVIASVLVFAPTTPAGAATGATISGTVRNEFAVAQAGITVDVYSSYYGSIVATTTTGSGGAFTVAGLAAASFRLRFTDPNRYFGATFNGGAISFPAAPDVVTTAGTVTTVNQVLLRAGTITGAVTDAVGEPAGTTAVVVTPAAPAAAWVVATAMTGAGDGTFEVRGLAPGAYSVLAVDPAYLASPPAGHRPSFNGDHILGTAATEFAAAPAIVVGAASTPSTGSIHLVPTRCDPATVAPRAPLTNRNFSLADLSQCLLTGANLNHAALRGTNLARAGLAGADLTGADLTNANLDHANLEGAILTGVTWSATVCPNGISSDSQGGTCTADGPLSFVADSFADGADAAPGDGFCATLSGACTLRAAVQEANATSAADHIVLAANRTYSLTKVAFGADTPAAGDLDLLAGAVVSGSHTTISSTAHDRVLQVGPGVIASMTGLTITGGKAGNGLPGGRGGDGGGILNAGGLTLDDVIVSGNEAGQGGAAGTGPVGGPGGTGGPGGRGGGIANTGTLTVRGGAVLGNAAGFGGFGGAGSATSLPGAGGPGGDGGGIFTTGTLDIGPNSSVSGNRTGLGGPGGLMPGNAVAHGPDGRGGDGGGVSGTGRATVTDSTVADNEAIAGGRGGAMSVSGTTTIDRSTVSGNLATGSGSGAGGLRSGSGQLTITNTTIAGNGTDAGGSGGGLVVAGGATTLTHVTISSNHWIATGAGTTGPGPLGLTVTGGTVVVRSSIVAQQIAAPDCSGAVTTQGYNVESATTCGFASTGDRQNADALLGPLAVNGGPTMTLVPAVGSPAVDAVPFAVNGCGTTVTTDQRALPRPAGGAPNACDVGAVER